MEELRQRIQSLELKLVASSTKNDLGSGKKKKMKTKGTVTAPTKKSKPTSPKTNSHRSPTSKNNVSAITAKNPKKKKSRINRWWIFRVGIPHTTWRIHV